MPRSGHINRSQEINDFYREHFGAHSPANVNPAPPIIFLDIDGVMNNLESLRFPRTKVKSSKLSFSAAHPSCVAALNHVTVETDAKIVVSSTWRGIGIEVLSEIFVVWGITGEIVGRTPDLSKQARDSPLWQSPERGEEVAAWLNTNQSVGSFVILDDGDDMGELKPSLVQTNYEVGLTITDAKKAIEYLGQGRMI